MANFQGQKNLKPKDKEKRFWSKVDIKGPDNCWNYKEHKNLRGYGQFDKMPAHRVAWQYFHKTEIPYGRLILHKCDNPSCCNPKHLYCGTHQDNMNDRTARRRVRTNPNPSKCAFGKAKFHAGEIWLIRRLRIKLSGYKARYKYSQEYVAKMFNTCQSIISIIWNIDKYPCKEGYYVKFNN